MPPATWDYLKGLGLDPGIQQHQRPKYTALDIARGMAFVEDRRGHRPTSSGWTNDVRKLKAEIGPGVIPGKPTIFAHFGSWPKAWLFVETLRARGIAGRTSYQRPA